MKNKIKQVLSYEEFIDTFGFPNLYEGKGGWVGIVITSGNGKLTEIFQKYKTDDMKDWAHQKYHMTIAMNGIPEDLQDRLDETVELTVTAVGWNDKAIGVKVSGPMTSAVDRKTPHITLAYPKMGGKGGIYTNDVTNWKSIPNFKIKGKLQKGL